MSQHGTIRRYSLIIEKIGNKQFPSLKKIKDHLYDHGFEISDRTLQRDIEQIRFEFGLQLTYDRSKNGYFIDEEHSIRTDSFLRFLEIVTTAELLVDSLKESKEALDHISFESNANLKGIENLKDLLFAVRNNRKISFDHENFHSGKMHHFSIQPYLLKEFRNRWYVIGVFEDSSDLYNFGIDRITKLEIETELFEPDNKLRINELFDHVVGLTHSLEDPQEIVLSFTPVQGKYVKSLPWHISQEILVDNGEEVRVRMYIVPNYEFRQQILAMGDAVKVIKPEKLLKDIKKILERGLKQYE